MLILLENQYGEHSVGRKKDGKKHRVRILKDEASAMEVCGG